jgi:hypothetical protein
MRARSRRSESGYRIRIGRNGADVGLDRGEPRLGLVLVIGVRRGRCAVAEGKGEGKVTEAEGVEIFSRRDKGENTNIPKSALSKNSSMELFLPSHMPSK